MRSEMEAVQPGHKVKQQTLNMAISNMAQRKFLTRFGKDELRFIVLDLQVLKRVVHKTIPILKIQNFSSCPIYSTFFSI